MTFGVLAIVCGIEVAMILAILALDWRANRALLRTNLPVATVRRMPR